MSDFSEDLLAKNYFKHDNILILKTFTDPLDWLVTFCLSSDFPSEKGWHYIIEGLLGLESGKLYATPIENTELEIKMKPGVYRFRVYFGPNKNNDECWQNYFWPTDETERNEVKIRKPYASGSFPG